MGILLITTVQSGDTSMITFGRIANSDLEKLILEPNAIMEYHHPKFRNNHRLVPLPVGGGGRGAYRWIRLLSAVILSPCGRRYHARGRNY